MSCHEISLKGWYNLNIQWPTSYRWKFRNRAFTQISKCLTVHTWWIIYLKNSKHSGHQKLRIKACCSKGALSAVKYLALTLLYVAKTLPFIEAVEGVINTRRASAVNKTRIPPRGAQTQWHCLKNLLSFLNHGIKVPRSCRGPWKSGISQPKQSPLPTKALPNAQWMKYITEFRRYTSLSEITQIRELCRRPDPQPAFPIIPSRSPFSKPGMYS